MKEDMDSVNSDSALSHFDHIQMPIGKVQLSGHSNEFIILGCKKYYKDELREAFGGTLNPGLSPLPTRNFANAVPVGLCGFGLSMFVLSLYNANAQGVHTPNVVVGLCVFYGGIVQILAGFWDLICGNLFGGTVLSSYGGFWVSFGVIYIDGFGILKAYEGTDQLGNAVGILLTAWAIFTFMLMICTLKSTVAFFSLFLTLFSSFVLLAIGNFTGNNNVVRAGGVVGTVCAFLGWYNALEGMTTKTNSYFVPTGIPLPKWDYPKEE